MVSTSLWPDSIEKRSDAITKTKFAKLWIGWHGVSRKNEIKNVHINSKKLIILQCAKELCPIARDYWILLSG